MHQNKSNKKMFEDLEMSDSMMRKEKSNKEILEYDLKDYLEYEQFLSSELKYEMKTHHRRPS